MSLDSYSADRRTELNQTNIEPFGIRRVQGKFPIAIARSQMRHLLNRHHASSSESLRPNLYIYGAFNLLDSNTIVDYIQYLFQSEHLCPQRCPIE